MKQLLLDIQPAATPTLDNFVTGRNAEALHSVQQSLSNASSQRFIYLWGPSGSGKSHILQAAQAAGVEVHTVDDVHQLDEPAQIALFNRYNQLRDSGSGILISAGHHAPTQMGLRDDLATRLAWGLVYQLHALTDQEKALALRKHAQARGMKLPDEVLDYCLRHLRRDLPSLMATLNALDQWSLTYKRAVTLPLLRELLQPRD